MTLRLKTLSFQDMLSKAIKGASNNKMIPITSLMAIELKDNVLTLTTTDATNVLKIIAKDIEGDDFYVVVQVDLFSKLIAKTTTENITLTLNENHLQIKGNGQYTIELPLDEDGKLIQFPKYKFDESVEKSVVNLSVIHKILTTNKAALATTMEIPCLTGYYCSDSEVISTDTFKVCSNKTQILPKPVLIPSELMELLSVVTEEKITVQTDNDNILFTTPGAVIFGTQLEGIEDYPVEPIKGLLSTEMQSMCKLPKSALLNVLDRLSLFVSTYDKNGLYMTFDSAELIISTKQSNGAEHIKYQSVENFAPFTCCIDIELLRSQVAAQSGEVVELWYGNDGALKMICEGMTQIVALSEDDRTGV